MKIYIRPVLLFFMTMPLLCLAQSKVGHVNTLKILEVMPEVKVANMKLDSLNSVYQNQLKQLDEEYKNLVAKKDTFGVTQILQRSQDFEQYAKSDFQKTSDSLMAPIHKKLSGAIKAVSEEGKYTIVFDYSQEGISVYVNQGDDITEAVKKKLGLN
jgi:outer membrane protein